MRKLRGERKEEEEREGEIIDTRMGEKRRVKRGREMREKGEKRREKMKKRRENGEKSREKQKKRR